MNGKNNTKKKKKNKTIFEMKQVKGAQLHIVN